MRLSEGTTQSKQAGLTLVELLVVLSILAVLSTVALRSVTDLATEARYDANVEQLDAIEEAILGDRYGFVGFIGDVGRLPNLVSDSFGAEFHLNELLNGGAIEPFSIQTPAGDNSLRLPCGWRGPYLNLGANRDFIADGFGKPFSLSQPNGSSANTNGDPIGSIASLGLSNAPGGADFEQDLFLTLEDTTTVNWSQDVLVVVSFESDYLDDIDAGGTGVSGDPVYDGTEEIVVRVYGAGDDSTTSGLVEAGKLVTLTESNIDPASEGSPQNFEFNTANGNRIPYGQKIFRAYFVETAPTDLETDLNDDNLRGLSPPVTVDIDRFTNTIALEIQVKPASTP